MAADPKGCRLSSGQLFPQRLPQPSQLPPKRACLCGHKNPGGDTCAEVLGYRPWGGSDSNRKGWPLNRWQGTGSRRQGSCHSRVDTGHLGECACWGRMRWPAWQAGVLGAGAGVGHCTRDAPGGRDACSSSWPRGHKDMGRQSEGEGPLQVECLGPGVLQSGPGCCQQRNHQDKFIGDTSSLTCRLSHFLQKMPPACVQFVGKSVMGGLGPSKGHQAHVPHTGSGTLAELMSGTEF